MSTNYTSLIFLINDNVRAIKAVYEPLKGDYDPNATSQVCADGGTHRTTNAITFKTFDNNIVVGDLILVPSKTRFGVTTCKVVEVDIEPDVETHVPVDWVMGVVDKAAYDEVLAMESAAINTVKKAEKTDRREKLKEKVFAHMKSEEIAKLAITHAKTGDGGPVIEPDAKPE